MLTLPLTTILLLLDDSGLTWPRTIPNRLKGNICQEITFTAPATLPCHNTLHANRFVVVSKARSR